MSTGISITVNALDISDLAEQLRVLAAKFAGIAVTMASPLTRFQELAGERPAVADGPTPLEEKIIADQTAKEQNHAPPKAEVEGPPRAASGRGKKKETMAAPKPPKPPKDRIFDGDAEGEAAAEGSKDAGPSGPNSYVDDMSTEDAFVRLRALAKLVYDQDGKEALQDLWTKHWAKIVPEHKSEAPGLKWIEGNRDAIARAIVVFDTHHGHDPVTGEPAASLDPAADLL